MKIKIFKKIILLKNILNKKFFNYRLSSKHIILFFRLLFVFIVILSLFTYLLTFSIAYIFVIIIFMYILLKIYENNFEYYEFINILLNKEINYDTIYIDDILSKKYQIPVGYYYKRFFENEIINEIEENEKNINSKDIENKIRQLELELELEKLKNNSKE